MVTKSKVVKTPKSSKPKFSKKDFEGKSLAEIKALLMKMTPEERKAADPYVIEALSEK
jgi:hypothetical protein